ncbi:Acyltransferase LovD [Spathaspora sp. JA1]|nr:Acyltransferase LovD [Spathaspora sp. JA1]
MKLTRNQINQLRKSVDEIISDITTSKPGQTPELIAPGCVIGVTDEQSTIYLNGGGIKNLTKPESNIDINDVFGLFSCTKSLTITGALILYERGKLNLDIPISKYVPEIETIGVLEPGIIDKKTGTYLKPPRKPKTSITAKHLMMHLAGFSYGFLHPDYYTLITKGERMDAVNPTKDWFTNKKTPLVHEPGSAFMYGHNTDWLGFVIEAITGMKLGEFLEQELFKPIGMNNCTFHLRDLTKLVPTHYRNQDDSLSLMKKYALFPDPILDLGGQGCFGTVGDYLKFMRLWLNKGRSPDTGARVLNETTVEFALQNHFPPGIEIEFLGMSSNGEDEYEQDGWTLTGNAITMNDLPTGRPRGSIYWSGLANLYYWMDFENKIGGFFAVQILPFLDEYVVNSYQKFEKEVYNTVNGSKKEIQDVENSKL